jgi:hypothetical protein
MNDAGSVLPSIARRPGVYPRPALRTKPAIPRRAAGVLAALIMLPLSHSAAAVEELGWYGGGGIAATNYKEPDLSVDMSKRGLVGTSRLTTQAVPWELVFGYRASNYLGFEVGYLHLDKQAGSMDLTAPFLSSVDAMQESDGFSLLGRGALPLSRVFSVVANAGIYIWHIESTASSLAGQTAVSALLEHRGVAPRMGLGLEAIVSERSTLRFEAHVIGINHQTAGVFSINFLHYFGGP